MRARALGVCLLASLAWTPAAAQRATEQFIPIGRSPGLSAAETTIARVEAVDPAKRTLVVAGQEIAVADTTRVWLDRSAAGRTNALGSLADCLPGRIVEVRLEPAGGPPTAAWIKVQIPEASP